MEALRFSFQDSSLTLSKIDLPKISFPNEVLIKVAFAGICGTDLHIVQGEFPCKSTCDLTLGHEISGIVVEVGEDVVHLEEGDRVVIDPNDGCKRCSFCHAGKPHFCKAGCATNTIGICKDGGWAKYVVAPEEQVYKLNFSVTLERAGALSDIIHGWDIINPMDIGDKVLLMGGGILGCLWASTFHLAGHRNVTICEPVVERFDFIKKLNTGYDVLTCEDLQKNAFEEPDRFKFDVVVDCSGTPAVIEQGILLLRAGGKFCMFGVAPPCARIQISPFDVFWKELKILGSKSNPFTFSKALGLLEAMGGKLNFSALGIKMYQLSQYREAMNAVKKGIISKAIFKM